MSHTELFSQDIARKKLSVGGWFLLKIRIGLSQSIFKYYLVINIKVFLQNNMRNIRGLDMRKAMVRQGRHFTGGLVSEPHWLESCSWLGRIFREPWGGVG